MTEESKLIEALELVAGRLDETAQYLSAVNRKLADIDDKLAVLVERES